MKDPAEAVLTPLSEEDLARRYMREGNKVIQAHGRWWLQTLPGLYDAVHWFARHTLEEAKRPTVFCWGYRAVLHEDLAASANGALPVQVITDVEGYDLDRLAGRTQKDLARFERNDARIVWLDDPEILLEQGYDVMLSWIGRTRHRAPESRQTYLARMSRNAQDRTRLMLAGVRGDTLLGYVTSFIVDGTAYMSEIHLSTEALSCHLSTALWFETAQFYRRRGLAREICAGLMMPEKDGLTDYKARLGFDLVRLPTRVWLLPGLAGYAQKHYPAKYYRFTGTGLSGTAAN